MKQKEIEKLHNLDDSNWWLKARRNLLLKIMPEKIKTVFEIGAGTGRTLEMLKEKGFSVEGLDSSKNAVKFAQRKGIELKHSAIENFYFVKKYDLVLLLDVLEHLEEDSEALKQISKSVEENKFIFLTVPAFQFLFGPHDKLLYHFRRYNKNQIKFMLELNGFKVEKISYWNFFLFFPSVSIKLFKKFFYKNHSKAESDLNELFEPLNSVLYYILKFENFLISKGINFPFGTSIVCLARKK